ncbi:sodium:solute symporter [Akkermansia sp.]|uniref:sodium:solute symporter n=1 Tax=Akkermansia sp. TaxID=1872421 RepID=UPI003A843F30
MFTDSLVIATYFLAIFGIGIYAGRKQKTLTDYALGNRSLPWWAILASILAAEISAATFLGAPGEGYHTRNFTYAQLCIGTILGRIIVGKLFLKPYYDYKGVSIDEYLETRFGLLTRRTASMVFLISRVLASGTRLYFAGILLVIAYQFITNTPADSEQIVLLYIAALVIISIATTIYTAIGGLKAVVWTDVLQAAVLGVSMLSALWILFSHIPGGWDSISAVMNGGDDWKFFSWGTEKGLSFLEQCSHILGQEYTVWAAFLGATFITMATHGTDQDMVQRMLAAKNSKAGTRAVIVSGLMDFPIVLLFLFTGILLYVFYQYNPAALPADTPKLHVFPYFIIHELPGGVRGLLIAGLLATAMGSLSTALNSLATTATKDWYQGIFKPDATERQLLRCVRWGTVGFSLLLIMVGSVTAWYVVHHPEVRIIQIALGIFGYTYGSLLGIFLLGMLTRTRGNDTGNILAMAAGFIVIAVLTGLIPLPASWEQHIPEIAFPWRVTIGTLATFFVGLCFRSRHELPR